MVIRFILLFLVCLSTSQFTYIQYDTEIPTLVQKSLTTLIQQSSPYPIVEVNATAIFIYSKIPASSYILSFGTTNETQTLIPTTELQSAGPEGYIVRSHSPENQIQVFVANGNPQEAMQPFVVYNNIGLHYGCYELLRQLGFGFYHPLQTLIPSTFRPQSDNIDIFEQPRWTSRGWHYHTEHPLELTEYLNGMNSSSTPWESMTGEFSHFAEWLIANRQNRLEWVLLWTRDWDTFAWSQDRQNKLKEIVDILHIWGIAAGADVPIAEQQQHAWYMTGPRYSSEVQHKNITDHIDWIMEIGYDFIATESGYSEFTHPNCSLMLEWMNFAAEYVTKNFEAKRMYIKCHCSSGQVCEDYLNPYTGEPINFNFLPAFATPDLGVYPHTVQIYNFTEPAPTYGNVNFTYMLEFLVEETGKREVVFHGETAYWVNYDIDVPLFLSPIYGANRLSDMRTVAKTTSAVSREAQGQMNFGSGWEWSYWLGDLITQNAVWDPMESVDEATALDRTLTKILQPMGSSDSVENLKEILLKIIDVERDLLIYGNWNGTAPSDIIRRNGQAYVAGWDTWSEWAAIVNPTDATQPAKLSFHNIRDPFEIFGDRDLPNYKNEIQPLLLAMSGNFSSLTSELASLRSSLYPESFPFF